MRSPLEYTVYNEVSIVPGTKLNFEEFWAELEALENKNESKKAENGMHQRAVVREALVSYVWPKIVIEPIQPGNPQLYDAHYEHVKQVFGHKFVKDFIIRTGKSKFSKQEIKAWFEPTPVDKSRELK